MRTLFLSLGAVSIFFFVARVDSIQYFIDLPSFLQLVIPLLLTMIGIRGKRSFMFYKGDPQTARVWAFTSLLIGLLVSLISAVVFGSNVHSADMPTVIGPALSIIILPAIYALILSIFIFLPFSFEIKENG